MRLQMAKVNAYALCKGARVVVVISVIIIIVAIVALSPPSEFRL